MMGKLLLVTGIFVIPTAILIVWFAIKRHRIERVPLLLAALSFAVYISLLRAPDLFPALASIDGLTLNWVGKTLAILGTLAMIYLMPNVDFRSAGLVWKQNKGSLKPVLLVGVPTVLSTVLTATLVSSSPNTSAEWLLFQATLPGLDEEIFMRGLLLLLLHQSFGKSIQILGATTGWAFGLVVIFFSLLHGVTLEDGGLSFNFATLLVTGLIGIILTWMRVRTGSLVAPIIFHNTLNVALAFF